MKFVVWGLIVFLLIAHQDFWLWDDGTLLFGFLPVGLAYHIGISLAAVTTWLLAVLFIWPSDLDEASQIDEQGANNV